MNAPLRAPFTVCLWLTETCNLRCGYCYAAPFSGRRMDTARAKSLLAELGAIGVFDVTLAGGEPLTHPDWLEIVDAALASGVRVGLLSNGTLLDGDAVETLRRTAAGRDFILQISLDSPEEEINDACRGKTSATVAAIDAAAAAGLHLQIACVVHKLNFRSAHRLLDRFYPAVKRFHFLNVQRTAQSLHRPELLMSEEEVAEFWPTLERHAQSFPSDLFLPSLRVLQRTGCAGLSDPESELNSQASFQCPSCSAGWTHVDIRADFDVVGCDIAHDFTVMGNVRDRAFGEVWRSDQADRVRAATFPPCYLIRDKGGNSPLDWLRSDLGNAQLPVQP